MSTQDETDAPLQLDEPDAAGAGERVRNVPDTPAAILGEIAWLMMSSPAHKHLFLADLEWLVAPAVSLRQFQLFRTKEIPVAYASWAFVSDEVADRLSGGVMRLQPGEWRSGEKLWLIDLVAPFGGADKVLKFLKETKFPEIEISGCERWRNCIESARKVRFQ